MIEIKNLTFGYGSRPVFRNLSVDFKEGSIYGLLGENGVGKTDLLFAAEPPLRRDYQGGQHGAGKQAAVIP